jgi:guanine deaminase
MIMAPSLAFHGTLIHSTSAPNVEILYDSLLITNEQGQICNLLPNIRPEDVSRTMKEVSANIKASDVQFLPKYDFIIPGFVDTHNHAPQFPQRGLGQGLHILDWLSQLTFPNEAKFANASYARHMYERCVDCFLKQGVTTASYYGSLHGEATKILATICLQKGQRALVGKCNMDRNAPDYYKDTSAEESLQVTEDFISHIRSLDSEGKLIKPILTPRFAISCTDDLLAGLGQLAIENPDLPIQTHFNEAQQEIDATLSLFPAFSNEVDLYDHFHLLTPRTILAHCTIMQDSEMERFAQSGAGVAHCPVANTTIGGGFMAAPIRRFLDKGVNVGLGTDSGGGFSSSILDAMRQALIVSNSREAQYPEEKGLTLDELFHMATLGGARVCGLGDKIGSFAVGKGFDAMVVTPNQILSLDASTALRDEDGVMTPVEADDSTRDVFEKFLISGDDRNISEVYVQGRQVKARTTANVR